MPILLKKIPFFHGLSDAELEAIRSCLHEKNFEKGEVLLEEGSCCERVFFVQSGRIKLYRTSSNGREQILETLGPGDTCACNPGSAKWHCNATAQAVSPSTVWFLNRNDYARIVNNNSKVAHTLNQLFADRLRNFSSLIEEVSLKDAKRRVIKFLLDMLAEKEAAYGKGKEGAIFIPYTQEEIAQRIGAARETVTRQLNQLKRSKLIDIKPHQIIILNKPVLEKLL